MFSILRSGQVRSGPGRLASLSQEQYYLLNYVNNGNSAALVFKVGMTLVLFIYLHLC